MDLSGKSVLVWDRGIFLSLAVRLSQPDGFGTVYYHNPANIGYPSINEMAVGTGYPGIEVVRRPMKIMDKVDVVAFPDCHDEDLQWYLRQHGKDVWGSGEGADMENARFFGKQLMDAVGLPVNDYKLLTGLEALDDFLEKHPDWIVKLSHWRGLTETWTFKRPEMRRLKLANLAYKLGPLSKEIEFVVEKKIETKIERGYSGAFFAGQFPKYCLTDAEIKDSAYLAVVQEYAKIDPEIRAVNDALLPALKDYAYANLFATEMRDDVCIDLTCRQGSPSGEAQMQLWKNLPLVVWHGAHGEFVEPEPAAKYAAQVMLENDEEPSEWCSVGIPKEIDPYVYLYFGMKRGEENYVVPQWNPFSHIGTVVAIGNTPEEATSLCRERAEKIEGKVSAYSEKLDDAEKEWALMGKRMDLTSFSK